jgi:hypothetical protein
MNPRQSAPHPGPHPAELDVEALLAECSVRRTRGSGPGGQHRNKVETAVVITHLPSGIVGAASERRSQAENRDVAIQRLRTALAIGVRVPRAPDEEYVAGPAWRKHLRAGRIAISAGHPDFPALLAEALDLVVAADYETAGAARALGCTSTQLVRLLAREPAALQMVNEARARLGKRRLHAGT